MRLITGIAAEDPYAYWCRVVEHVSGREYPTNTRAFDVKRLNESGYTREQLMAAMWLYLADGRREPSVAAFLTELDTDARRPDPEFLVADELEARATVYAQQPEGWAKPGQQRQPLATTLYALQDTKRSWAVGAVAAAGLRDELQRLVTEWEDHDS